MDKIKAEKSSHDEHLITKGLLDFDDIKMDGRIKITQPNPYNTSLKLEDSFQLHRSVFNQYSDAFEKKMFVNDKSHMVETPEMIRETLRYMHDLRTVQEPKLCQGISDRPPSMDMKLKCVLLHKEDPYMKLGPFLFEELNLTPCISASSTSSFLQ